MLADSDLAPEHPVAPPLTSAASHSGVRPGTSMGLTNSRLGSAARVTLEEKRRRDREIALEDGVSTTPCLLTYRTC